LVGALVAVAGALLAVTASGLGSSESRANDESSGDEQSGCFNHDDEVDLKFKDVKM
jgi:hypothetical protein